VDEILDAHLGPKSRHPDKGCGFGPEGPVRFIRRHLGTSINLERGLWQTPPETCTDIVKMAKRILISLAKHRRWIGNMWVAQFGGLCVSTMLSNGQARFRTRPFHDFLVRSGVHVHGYGGQGKMNRREIRAVEWWANLDNHSDLKRSIWRPPVTEVWATDASTRGHGALDHARPLDEVGPGDEMGVPSLGIWTDAEREKHMCALELRAFLRKLELECRVRGPSLRGKTLLLWEDNKGVVGILNKLESIAQG
jgi:hypothetical protein